MLQHPYYHKEDAVRFLEAELEEEVKEVEVSGDALQVGARIHGNQLTKTAAKTTKGLGIINKTEEEEEPAEGAARLIVGEGYPSLVGALRR